MLKDLNFRLKLYCLEIWFSMYMVTVSVDRYVWIGCPPM